MIITDTRNHLVIILKPGKKNFHIILLAVGHVTFHVKCVRPAYLKIIITARAAIIWWWPYGEGTRIIVWVIRNLFWLTVRPSIKCWWIAITLNLAPQSENRRNKYKSIRYRHLQRLLLRQRNLITQVRSTVEEVCS